MLIPFVYKSLTRNDSNLSLYNFRNERISASNYLNSMYEALTMQTDSVFVYASQGKG